MDGPDDHLAGEFHSGRDAPHLLVNVLPDGAESGVRVLDVTPVKHHAHKPCQQGIADMLVQKGHGLGMDPVHAVPQHEVCAPLQNRLHKEPKLRQIVTQVAIGHHKHRMARSLETAADRGSVTPVTLIYHGSPGLSRPCRRLVSRTVVDNNHLARHAQFLDSQSCRLNDACDRLFFVETGNDDRYALPHFKFGGPPFPHQFHSALPSSPGSTNSTCHNAK